MYGRGRLGWPRRRENRFEHARRYLGRNRFKLTRHCTVHTHGIGIVLPAALQTGGVEHVGQGLERVHCGSHVHDARTENSVLSVNL